MPYQVMMGLGIALCWHAAEKELCTLQIDDFLLILASACSKMRCSQQRKGHRGIGLDVCVSLFLPLKGGSSHSLNYFKQVKDNIHKFILVQLFGFHEYMKDLKKCSKEASLLHWLYSSFVSLTSLFAFVGMNTLSNWPKVNKIWFEGCLESKQLLF